MIEPKAFQHLTNLNWISFWSNNLKSLPYRFFKNNPGLIYIDFCNNQINSIHPEFFDGLQMLKKVTFGGNNCTQATIGCEGCLVSQTEIQSKFVNCFENGLKEIEGLATQNFEKGLIVDVFNSKKLQVLWTFPIKKISSISYQNYSLAFFLLLQISPHTDRS